MVKTKDKEATREDAKEHASEGSEVTKRLSDVLKKLMASTGCSKVEALARLAAENKIEANQSAE